VLRQPTPTISATIRFDSFVMMGLYPAEPVVTGVRNRTTSSMPVATIRFMTDEKTSTNKLTFEDALEQFDEISRSGGFDGRNAN
jgi:hypothetical protein